jgi:hypothetical protein
MGIPQTRGSHLVKIGKSPVRKEVGINFVQLFMPRGNNDNEERCRTVDQRTSFGAAGGWEVKMGTLVSRNNL